MMAGVAPGGEARAPMTTASVPPGDEVVSGENAGNAAPGAAPPRQRRPNGGGVPFGGWQRATSQWSRSSLWSSGCSSAPS